MPSLSHRVFLALTLWFLAGAGFAQPAPLPPKENFQIFLLIGQSNMAGRGTVTPADQVPYPRVLMFNQAGEWVPAVDPMHFDKPVAGVGLGRTFGIQIADATPGATIGLIPCAVGGSPIDSWLPGALDAATKTHPWDDAMCRAKAALAAGTLKGILWHQGESDSKSGLAPAYAAKLADLITRLRAELNAPTAPFIAGQMGKFAERPWDEFRVQVDQAHRDLPGKMPHTAFVSSEGLTHRGDMIHFDSDSYRELGRRYATAYQNLGRASPASATTLSEYRAYPATSDPALRLFARFSCATPTGILLVKMHGWHGQVKTAHSDNIPNSAANGYFVVEPEMRGRGDATGSPDCNGWELQDVIDAVEFAKRHYRDRIASPQIVLLSGGSGGGGNAYALVGKFPDYFSAAVMESGISDYLLWHVFDAKGEFRDEMEGVNGKDPKGRKPWIGGSPAMNSEAYRSRGGLTTVANLLTPSLLIHGAEDLRVPALHARLWAGAAQGQGHGPLVTYHELAGVR